MKIVKDIYVRSWIIEKAVEIMKGYPSGMTVRQLHYRLVAIGMTNDIQHYKRVVGAMTKARWDATVDFDSFIDRDRSMHGETKDDEKDLDTEIESAKEMIKLWMTAHYLNRWSNQDNYVEVWIEKKALQGVFEGPCGGRSVGLAPCKGYPSLTFVHDAVPRFEDAIERGKTPIILYFGDYDPSGQNIPETIKENLYRMGVDVEVKRLALNPDQIEEMGLPGVPAKVTDTRSRNWTGGDVVELDAVEPETLSKMCRDAIAEHFNKSKYLELKKTEADERIDYQAALKEFVQDMTFDDDDEKDEG